MKPTRGTFASQAVMRLLSAIALMKSRRRIAYPRAPSRWRFQVIKT